MNSPTRQYYEFGPFRLDTVRRLLLRDGLPVAITSKAFDTLLALVQNGGQTLEKEYLLNRVWPDTIVEEKNLTVTISVLRKALGESPGQHQFIATVPGRGYRFVASVKEVTDGEPDLLMAQETSQRIVVEPEGAGQKPVEATTGQFDLPAAESEFKRAIELNPNYVTAHQWYSEYLTAMGRVDESVAEAKSAQRIDPVSPEVGWDLGLALLFGRRYDEAVEELGQAVELDDRFWLTHAFLGWAYGEKREFDKALTEYEKARSLDDNADILSQLVVIYVKAGRRSDAQRVAEELIQRSKQEYISPFYLAAADVALGNNDKGIRWLQKAYEERAELLVFIKVAPNFDSLRSDPRFLDLVRGLGLAP